MNKTISLAALTGVVLILALAVNLSPIVNQATAQETPIESEQNDTPENESPQETPIESEPDGENNSEKQELENPDVAKPTV